MAKQLEVFTKEFGEIEKAVDAGMEEIVKSSLALRQTSGIMEEGAKELGHHVQELKDKGMQGTHIEDFKSDKQVQTVMAHLDSYLKQAEKELARITALNPGFQKTKARFTAFKTDLSKEISDRKKQVSTLVGSGNKSLPDLEKLLVKVKAYENAKHYSEFFRFGPGNAAFLKKQLQDWITEELSKTKGKALTEFQEMMMKQALDARNLVMKFNRVRGLHQQYKELAAAIQADAASGKMTEMLTAQGKLIPLKKELDEIVDLYDRALKDEWLSARVADSPEKSKIQGAVQAMIRMKAETDKDFTLVAHMKARPVAAR